MAPATPDVAPEGWDQASALYDELIAPTTGRYAEELLDALGVRAGERVLDVAAGSGALAMGAARRGARVLATDFAPEMIARLQRRASEGKLDVEARVMDGQRLTLPDASFDAAASVFGLIFFPDRARGLAELHRVLRPGGRVGIASWSAPERVPVVAVFSTALRSALPDRPAPPGPPAVFSMADAKRAEDELVAAGFRGVRVRSVTHAWRFRDAGAVWTRLAPASPVFAAMLQALDAAQRAKVRDALDGLLRERYTQGSEVVLPGEAHLITATR
jgi:SAM-dependent methyltransferase